MSGTTWAACLLALPLLVTLSEPALFVGALFVALLLAVAALYLTLVAARARIVELEGEAARRDREDGVVRLPLRSVPMRREVPRQRDGEHDRLAMSRAEWDAIERETRES